MTARQLVLQRIKRASIFLSRRRKVVLSIEIGIVFLFVSFCFETRLLKAQSCWFALYQWRPEKGSLMTQHTHTHTLLLIHTTSYRIWRQGHRSPDIKSRCSRSYVLVKKNKNKKTKNFQSNQNCCVVVVFSYIFFIAFLSKGSVILLGLGFPLTHYVPVRA